MPSSERRYCRFALAAGAAVAVACGSALAADSRIQVHESTFEDLLDALEPIEFSGRYAFRTGFITWCDSAYEGEVEDISIDVTPAGLVLEGDVTVSWCGFNFGSRQPELQASGDVTYHAASGTIRVDFDSVVYTPRIDVFNETITLPIIVNLGSMLNIPPIPYEAAVLTLNLPDGRRYLPLRATNVRVTMRDNHLRITSDAVMP